MSAKENCEDKRNTILAFRKLCACLSASMSNTTGGGSRVLKTNLIRSKVTQGQDFRHHQSMSVRFGNGGLERGDNQNTLYIPMTFSKNKTYTLNIKTIGPRTGYILKWGASVNTFLFCHGKQPDQYPMC